VHGKLCEFYGVIILMKHKIIIEQQQRKNLLVFSWFAVATRAADDRPRQQLQILSEGISLLCFELYGAKL